MGSLSRREVKKEAYKVLRSPPETGKDILSKGQLPLALVLSELLMYIHTCEIAPRGPLRGTAILIGQNWISHPSQLLEFYYLKFSPAANKSGTICIRKWFCRENDDIEECCFLLMAGVSSVGGYH
ncbi:hypothetical protein Y1Q_0009698 [Alligator mississippiensis]|uniref:Uncharacterized protein n=1 Tax=Alligator mississippiensis TaxID=8496 RepID=A0A151MWF9_ALLMI|nr:hypothetical protein Y1Q_0009698 [Alligator mississippiensis]